MTRSIIQVREGVFFQWPLKTPMLILGKRVVRGHVPPRVLVAARSMQQALARSEQPLTAEVGSGRSGEVVIRPVRRDDAPTWTRAMRANHQRMRRWWGLADDAVQGTDRLAFEHHFQQWDSRRKRGTGLCLALVAPEGVIGELQVWHLTPGGLTCEVGLWFSPAAQNRIRSAGACLGYAFDRLIEQTGIRRIDAPVAVANPMPRPLLQLGGFEIEATIPRWRQLDEDLVDYDLFTLTPERWVRARPEVEAAFGPWSPVEST